jgi:peptidoglycan/xylan/chitin deacetylase (PgdA/CDA1 family)
MSWLDAVASALDAAPAPCPVFVRDDDAGWADDRLDALLAALDRAGMPVDLAVIPAAVGPGLRRVLHRYGGGGVRLHQHGLAHVDHEAVGRKCEFGRSRAAWVQSADIGAGRRILLDAFGDRIDPVFTPPWNRCTAATGAALHAHGIRVLSRDVTAVALHQLGLTEIPVTVDWFGHRRGVRLTLEEVAARIAGGVRAGGPVGLMLHHAVTGGEERGVLAELLHLLGGHPLVAPTTIVELAGVAA